MTQQLQISLAGPYKAVQVRVTTNGKHHRHVIMPGQDYSNEPREVQEVCAREHTQEVIDAYNNRPQGMLP